MSVVNQQASTQMRGIAPSWTVIAGGAIVLVLTTAAVTWLAYGAIAPKADVAGSAATGASSITSPALVEFRHGEQAPVLGGFVPSAGLVEFRKGEQAASASSRSLETNPALVEFRQGEQGGSAAVSGFTPAAGLIDFRHGEQGN